jgi:O-succinylbenzoate synthase
VIDLDDVLERLHVVSLPLHTRFRGVTLRECALIEGTHGWGEFSPFVEYEPDEARFWLEAALEAAFTDLPQPLRSTISVNATVPAVNGSAVASVMARYDGCTTAKVKVAEVGGSLAADLDRVAAVREVLGINGRIRVDANGGWSVSQAIAAIESLVGITDLEYVEQPCATVSELAQVRRHFGGSVLIAADESIRKADDPYRVREAEAADIAVLKVAPLGGVRRALEIAQEIGLPVVVSSELSSSIGLGIASSLAAALPELPYACGLATADLLAADITTEPLSPRNGSITVGRVTPDPDLLRQFAAPTARVQWWRERVKACWQR